jgi:flagellin
MTRINTNLPALVSAMYLNRNMKALNVALERLATGYRINTARDDPDGIIVTDVLRGELSGIQSAITNAERASNLMATAEGSVAGISDLLLQIKQTIYEVSNSADLTEAEIAAKQQQLDNLIEAINSSVRSASFGGQKLLDGSLAYTTDGVDSDAVTDLMIRKAPVGTASGGVPVQMDLTASAARGVLVFPAAAIAGDVSVRFTGPAGRAVLDFKGGTSAADIVTAITSSSDQTGLTAELVDPGDPNLGVRIMTQDYGSRASVKLEFVSGNPADFATQDEAGNPATTDNGLDIEGNINGAHVVGDGLKLHYASATMDLEACATEAWNATGPGASTTFEITSGGALFQIGAQIGAGQQESIGLPALDSSNLGLSAYGFLSNIASGGTKSFRSGLLGDMARIVDAAIQQVGSLRARIGSFQNNTLNMAINNLKQSQENISQARSQLLDADYAEETAAMTRQQILIEASRAAMVLANQVPQDVLRLLLE